MASGIAPITIRPRAKPPAPSVTMRSDAASTHTGGAGEWVPSAVSFHSDVNPRRRSPTPGHGSFFFPAEDGIRAYKVTGVQTCALPIYARHRALRRVPGDRRPGPAEELDGEL